MKDYNNKREYDNFNSLDDRYIIEEKHNSLNIIIPVCLILFAVIYFVIKMDWASTIDKVVNGAIFHKDTPVVMVKSSNQEDSEGFIDLGINQPTEYNYLSKAQVYDRRKQYVANSMFAEPDYTPNNDVFGQIEDYKPWWGIINCFIYMDPEPGKTRTTGVSKMSIPLNNPALLVDLIWMWLPYKGYVNTYFCESEHARLIPSSLKYNKTTQTFVVTYEYAKELLKTSVKTDGKRSYLPMQLSGINAIDFGYPYVYAEKIKNIHVTDETSDNFVTNYQKFLDFIHVGGSCEHKDGCNNGSPTQTNLSFYPTDLPAEIDLKLWKNRPISKSSKADVNYIIRIEDAE